MSVNSFGHLFRFTTWGESHGPAIGAVVDGCPPGIAIEEAAIQPWLDKRRPGTSRFTTQRREPDQVRILSGVFDGKTTGTPISLMIENVDQRSKDYSDVAKAYRPGHADYAYDAKYGFRDYRGGGRSSARETAARVAAGAVARAVIPQVKIRAWVESIGGDRIDYEAFDDAQIDANPFFCPDAAAAERWEAIVDGARKSGSSVGAVVACEAIGVPAGWGAPLYAKLDSELASACMSINAVKGFEIGDGFAAAAESLVGQALGAKNASRLRRGALLTSGWGMAICAMLALAFALAGPAIIDIMTTALDVQSTARNYLPYMIAAPVVGVAAWMFDGIFIGATRSRDMRNMMIISAIAYFAAVIPLMALFGNHGLWIGLFFSFIVRGATLAWKYPGLEAAAYK